MFEVFTILLVMQFIMKKFSKEQYGIGKMQTRFRKLNEITFNLNK